MTIREVFESRITPAGAGKTFIVAGFVRMHEDHPRRCGENEIPCLAAIHATGSPPQVRGKLIESAVLVGFSQDHPRRCGENLAVCRIVTFRPGSPPQVRGKPVITYCGILTTGITPAGAGKTKTRLTAFPSVRDHPRRCGENTKTY